MLTNETKVDSSHFLSYHFLAWCPKIYKYEVWKGNVKIHSKIGEDKGGLRMVEQINPGEKPIGDAASQAEYSGVLYEPANKPRHLSRVCSKTTHQTRVRDPNQNSHT